MPEGVEIGVILTDKILIKDRLNILSKLNPTALKHMEIENGNVDQNI